MLSNIVSALSIYFCLLLGNTGFAGLLLTHTLKLDSEMMSFCDLIGEINVILEPVR